MRACSGRTAMVAGILMGTIGLGTSAGAQAQPRHSNHGRICRAGGLLQTDALPSAMTPTV